MKKIIPVILLIALLSRIASGQDIHFSEFYNTPLQLNPSYAGFFDGDYRFTAIYRNQWDAITTPYSTLEGSADFRILLGQGSGYDASSSRSFIGIGIVASSDKAGDSQFSTNQASVSTAFSLATGVNRTNYISGGLSFGVGDASIDYSNLVFDEQYFEPNTPTTETVADNTYTYYSLSGGLAMHIIPNKFTNFNIGAAVYNINQPNVSFMDDPTAVLYRRYVIDASTQFSITNGFDLYPKMMYENQGPYSELDLGGLLRCNLSPGYVKNEGIYFGGFYRYGDAIILTTRIDLDAISFAFAYDVTISHLAIDGEGQGGPELSIIYIGKAQSGKHTTYCPRF